MVLENAYALIIGVDENKIRRLALPTVAKDVQAMYDVLTHPERCGYMPNNVRLLKGVESTRDNIYAAFDWLQDKLENNADATAIVYYSGHGMRDKPDDSYYLIPYDIDSYRTIRRQAIPAPEIAAQIAELSAERLLVILDCCHAAGMEVKDAKTVPDRWQQEAFPLDLSAIKAIPNFEAGSKDANNLLAEGSGRAILNSSTGAESSYIRRDRKMSVFTYHLIEALTGHAPHDDEAQVVYVTDVMSYVTRKVKQTVAQEGWNQTPVMRTTGVFPVALLIGGAGMKALAAPPNPLEGVESVSAETQVTTVTFNQEGQIVHGAQIQSGRDQHIDHVGDKINTGGGDYVRGDKKVMNGDEVGGDQITVGNISGSQGIAIGRGAQARVDIQQGITDSQLDMLFAPLIRKVQTVDPATVAKVEALKAQVARGEQAEDETLADLVERVVEAVPSVVEEVINLFTSSAIAKVAGGATNYVIKKLRNRRV